MRFEAVRRLLERLQSKGRRELDSSPPGTYTDSEMEFGRLVLPLLEDREEMKAALENLSRRAHALELVLNRLPVAALVLDGEGRLLTMSRAAKELFGGPAVTTTILSAACRAAAADEDAGPTLVPHPAQRGTTLSMVAADVAVDERGSDSAAERTRVVFVASTEAPPPVDIAVLISRFGLSRAEAGVVAVVAQGASNREAGERLELSTETARTHLASAYRKTGARNRAALVALAFGAPFGQGPISGPNPAVPD